MPAGSDVDFNPLFPYGKRRIRGGGNPRPLRFQSTLPIREETPPAGGPIPRSGDFNPLFPYGKRRGREKAIEPERDFNPLFPYGKRLPAVNCGKCGRIISIHSSHTGRDIRQQTAENSKLLFQSTLPIREETCIARNAASCLRYFNPLFPYGKRRDTRKR